MDCFFAREFAATFRATTPILGSSATFFQIPCFLPSLNWRALRKVFLSSKTSRTSGRITTRHSSPGRKTSAAPGLVLQIATANGSGECGDFICSVARAHFGRAVCRSFRFSFRNKTPQRQARRSESVLQRTRTRKKQNSTPHFTLRSNRFCLREFAAEKPIALLSLPAAAGEKALEFKRDPISPYADSMGSPSGSFCPRVTGGLARPRHPIRDFCEPFGRELLDLRTQFGVRDLICQRV